MKYNNDDIIEAGSDTYDTITFDWCLIDVCNYKCNYCSAGFGKLATKPRTTNFFKNKNKIDAWKQVISRLKLANIPKCEVNVLGGEPTLHPNLHEIVTELTKIEKVFEIQLITNFTKPTKYFEKFNTPEHNRSLVINPSVHFEYIDPVKFCNKLSEVDQMEHTTLEIGVMLHDNKKYWDDMEWVLNYIIEHNMHYYVQYIEPFHNYKPRYSTEMYERFGKYTDMATDHPTYEYKTKNKTYKLDQTEISKYDLTEFKGWSCKQMAWRINEDGHITRACNGDPLDLLSRNMYTTMICPHTNCKCDSWWDYKKIKDVTR